MSYSKLVYTFVQCTETYFQITTCIIPILPFLGLVRMRYIEADQNLSMQGQPLRDAIEDDIRQGLVPFWVSH